MLDFDDDLAKTKKDARAREELTKLDALYGAWDVRRASLAPALALVEDVARSEFDRETNLNARATAVASVAGVIVALSGAVAKTAFSTREWTDVTKLLAVAFFVVAVFCLTLSIFFTVLRVLRPARGPRTKSFLGETLVDVWNADRVSDLLRANPDRLTLLRFDRTMRTLPEWHVRNRVKARWLRRAWVFLAYGVLAIAIASVLVVGQTLGIPAEQTDGITTKVAWWHVIGFIVALGGLAWTALKRDWVGAKRGPREDAAEDGEPEPPPPAAAITALVDMLSRPIGHDGLRR